ncbi:neutral zinc metallopeptidase [Herbidospora cretacea]|uniref:neutral zinc metallopeptidase n=1 Tax=Herbidospora cretacea TaxID=28444 RepID=UPI0007746F29|nr:neutral zinc metallopeptidase [Herbidospora cretacea]
MGFARRALVTGLVAAVTVAVLVSPASADPELTGNDIYSGGPIARSVCAEKPVKKRNDVKVAKVYVTYLMGCLDRVWSKHLTKAGVKFKKPKLKMVTRNPASYCGLEWEKDSYSDYCEDNRELLIVLDRKLLNVDPSDLWLWVAVANRYAEHVQYLAGIEEAMLDLWENAHESEENEILRRMYLQSDCFMGAFTGSVYRSMPRKASEWKHIVYEWTAKSDEISGRAANIAYWMNRGFDTRDPKACNTWAAPSSRVA